MGRFDGMSETANVVEESSATVRGRRRRSRSAEAAPRGDVDLVIPPYLKGVTRTDKLHMELPNLNNPRTIEVAKHHNGNMTCDDAKEAARQAFTDENYPEALSLYTKALDQLSENGSSQQHDASTILSERQILLSNVIACRLKIGGEDMASTAVEEAKEVRWFTHVVTCCYCEVRNKGNE